MSKYIILTKNLSFRAIAEKIIPQYPET